MGQVIQAGAGQNAARGRTQGRHPDDRADHHDQQGLPLGHQRHRDGRPADPRRRARDRRGRRHGVDDPGAAPAPEEPDGFKYGDTALVDSMAYDALYDQFTDQAMINLTDGYNATGCRADPRGAGRLRRPVAPARRAGTEERPLRRRDRPRHDQVPQGRHRRQPGRGRARRHHGRHARGPAPGVEGRHHHRGHRLADLRRCRRGRRDEQGQGRGAAASAGSPRSVPQARSPVPTRRSSSSLPTPSRRPPRRRASRSPTSTCSSSTRPSPPSASSPVVSSASPRTRSTSTVAPSPSVTRSACPAPGSCCTSRTSSSAAGGGLGAAALCGGGGQGDALIIRVPQS